MLEMNATPQLANQVLSERTHLFIPSLPHWIGPTVDFLIQKATLSGACQETRSGKLMIALHEAITNAVLHGNLGLSSALKEQGDAAFAEAMAQRAADPLLAGRKVDIVVETSPQRCLWTITDQGRGFDVEQVLNRCLSDDPEILLSSGRGILMMRSFLDEVRFELGGSRVVLALHRQSGQERRAAARVPLHAPFKVAPVRADGTVDWSAAHEAVSRNLSENGVSLLQEHLQNSPRILVGIPTGPHIVYIPAEVRHCRSLEQGGFELGCEFVAGAAPAPADDSPPVDSTSPTPEVLQAIEKLLEQRLASRQLDAERRNHPRVEFNERFEIREEGRLETTVGFARDLSKGGISFITQSKPASEIVMFLKADLGGIALRVRARVVRCVKIMEGFYDVGASFVRLEPPTQPAP